MRKEMRQNVQEEHKRRLSERAEYGDKLFEKWSKKPTIGEGLDKIYEENPVKGRGLSIILENQARWLKSLTETQISNAFSTTPENVLRVVRLGYPNSVRGEIFMDYPMETSRDSIYYLSPVYTATSRGATDGNVTHQSAAYRYSSEIEEATVTGTVNGANQTFTGSNAGNVANPPIRPYTLRILVDGEPVAVDDGNGNVVGSVLNTGATNTIDYSSGALTINFTVAPATGTVITEQYHFDSEVASQYTDINSVELTLQDYQFRAKPWPLYVSWSKMTELLLGTTLDIDAEEALIKGAGEEVKKSLDFHALQLGYRYSEGNTQISFDADFSSAGADSEVAHAQSITRYIDKAGDVIYALYQRGGVSQIYGAPDAVNYLKLHKRFQEDNSQPKIGAYRIGSLDGIGIYKVPTSIVPAGSLVCVWKNENVPEDASIVFGSLIPLYQTQTLEYKEAYKETGLLHFGDWQATNSKYLVRMNLSNL